MARVRRILKQNKGETLMVAIVIMLVVMMVTVAILTASFALFQTVNGQGLQTQCHELAMNVSDVLDKQITAYMDKAEVSETPGVLKQVTAVDFKNSLLDGSLRDKNPLWYYIRCNMYQSTWTYWDSNNEDLNHLDSIAWKNFRLDEMVQGAEDGYLSEYDVNVTMYWLMDDEDGQIDPTADRPHEDFSTRLVLRVTCSCGKFQSTVTSEYMLSIGMFAEPQPTVSEEELTVRTSYSTDVYWQENWKFDRYTRR